MLLPYTVPMSRYEEHAILHLKTPHLVGPESDLTRLDPTLLCVSFQALPPEWAGETPPGFPNFNLPTIMTKQPTDGLDYNTYFYDPLVSWRLWRIAGTREEAVLC